MLKKAHVIFVLILALATGRAVSQENDWVLGVSRDNTVHITAPQLNRVGSGFLLDATHVVTCFHVVADFRSAGGMGDKVEVVIADTIIVTLSDGEVINATCVSVPTLQDTSPIINDFAILSLAREPRASRTGLPVSRSENVPDVGSAILFSCFSLGAPAMLTHTGHIAGLAYDGQLICLQAPVNKVNSGAALLSMDGEVIGIVTSREGGISRGLADVTSKISDLESGQSGVRMHLEMGGVNTLGVTKELIGTLDAYISTGIGYAHSITSLEDYLNGHPDILR